MKRVLLLLVVFFFVTGNCFGAESLTEKKPYQNGNMFSYEITWVAAADGSFTANVLDYRIDGFLMGLESNPGSTAPTASYDISITDADGLDIFGEAGYDRSATLTEFTMPLHNGNYGGIPVHSAVTLDILNNSVNAATGKIILYWYGNALNRN